MREEIEGGSRKFQYVQLPNEGQRYFCLQQSLYIAAWILYFQSDVFSPIERSPQKSWSFGSSIKWIRNYVGLLRWHTKSLIIFAINKYQWRRIGLILELPRYGQLCLSVHQGHKIFDLRRGVAIKVFDCEVHESVIQQEIELLQKVSCMDFSPSFVKWNIEERWYEEEFLNGPLDAAYDPVDSATLLKTFQGNVSEFLYQLILFQPPTTSNVRQYANSLIGGANIDRLLSRKSTVQYFDAINNFLNVMAARLEKEGECLIFLTFTHGDFVPANMVNTQHGLKIIDWEHAGSRSALFDFYSYFFYRSISRKVPVPDVVADIEQALSIFQAGLAENVPNVFKSVSQGLKVYRWIFFVEMIVRLLHREMSDKNLNVMNYILSYIAVFNEFEQLSIQSTRHDSYG